MEELRENSSIKNYNLFEKNIDQLVKIVNNRSYYNLSKKCFDKLISGLALVFLSPIFLLISIMIKIDDPKGPIFYSQVRIGKNGQPFKMYKFRSMVVDAEKQKAKLLEYNEVDGNMFKMKNDPRVTKVGKFIRKYSIDELPQIYNVLKGDMSLVGPRPPLKKEYENYTNHDKKRLVVTPGCTGLWQVKDRNNVGFDEMVKLDLKYISKSSFLYDIQIILKTFKIVIFPNDAY